ADAPGLHLEARLDVVDRLLEHLQRIVAGLLFDDVEAFIDDELRRAPLAVAHDAVDEFAHERALIERIRRNVALWDFSSTRHNVSTFLIGTTPSSVASRRTLNAPASVPERRPRQACRGRRGIGHPGDP